MTEQSESETVTDIDGPENSASLQVLTFLLDDEVYGVDIREIQEVLEYRKITRVPRTQAFLLGVINLRGRVVPVLDLRLLFDMSLADITVNTCIVIVDVMMDGERVSLGVLADAVQQVIELPLNEISPPPRIGSRVNNRFITGMGKYDGEFIIILNVRKILGEGELNDMLETVNEKTASETVDDSEG